jgi:plasmid maintenance system antidote protein VapI
MMMPVHPGRILKRELKARDLSANGLALALRVPSGRITGILNGQGGDTRHSAAVGTLFRQQPPVLGELANSL